MQYQIKSHPFYARLAYILVSIIALIYIAIIGKEILSPLIFSFLFSILLFPLASFLEVKLKMPRGLAAMLSVIVFLACILGVFAVLGTQLTSLANDWPMFKEQLITAVNNVQEWISVKFNIDKTHQLNYITNTATKMMSSGTVVLGATVMSLSSLMLFLVFTFIYTFFLLLYRRLIIKFLVNLFRDEHIGIVHDILAQIQYIIRKYLIGLLLQMLIISIITCSVLWMLNIKYAILLGLITGIINIIPYIGIFTAILLSALITFATAASLTKVLIVILALVVIHVLDSNILLPVVVGSKVKINAFITVLGVILGEMIWGISGMFLSIPVIAVMKIVFDRIDGLKPWGMLMGEDTV